VKIIIAAVGKVGERELRAVLDVYLARIRRYVGCEEVEIKSGDGFAKIAGSGSWIVACEVCGESLSSERFAERLEAWGSRGKGDVTFLIGGADGIPAEISRAAGARLSLSSMTLPHRLARVVLAEQIYRAFTILRGEPYARE
jgi:23S rRNA (pseudouridine1915-N3)-methyltransferase